MELLAPAGNFEKLKTAFHFGADAVYVAGQEFGLRAYASNFSNDELIEAVKYVHERNKKIYVTVNIFARNRHFSELEKYVKFLYEIDVDAVIVSDLGVFNLIRRVAPKLEIHVSTQASVTNYESALAWKNMGASRIVLARELTAPEIKEISKKTKIELECFVHGAMCISYSGRCLLSSYMTGRDSNLGQCAQSCRWKYGILKQREQEFEIEEDKDGSYILNSKDLCLIEYLDKIATLGVTSLKIEGRMKTSFYVAVVVSAYRKALDLLSEGKLSEIEKTNLKNKLKLSSHRHYTSGFMFDDNESMEEHSSSNPVQDGDFKAVVLGKSGGKLLIEQRNRFVLGDNLKILSSASEIDGETIGIGEMCDENGCGIVDAKAVQQKLWVSVLPQIYKLAEVGDILYLENK